MAVTSMRSFGSRAMRMVMARESGFARGILVPCICKTPCFDDCPRHAHWLSIPGPLVTPEVRLEAWDRRKTRCPHDVAPGRRRRLRVAIGAAISPLTQMLRGLAEACDSSARRRDCP